MGMVKLQNLPERPAGIDSLGKATENICAQGRLYNAVAGECGEHLTADSVETFRAIGQNVSLDLTTLYFVRHCERKVDKPKRQRRRPQRKPGVPLRRIVNA